MKRVLRVALGFALAALFLALIFRQVRIGQMLAAFREANALFGLAAVLVFLIGYSCRIERWRIMLAVENPRLGWKECAGPLFASVAANNVLPLRAGDVLRAFGFNGRLGICAATSITTLFVERLLDLLMVVSLFGLALAWFGAESSRIIGVGAGGLALIGMAILFVLLFPGAFRPVAIGAGRFIGRFSPALGQRAQALGNKVFSALDGMAKGHTMLSLICWSGCAWLAEGFVYWFAACALPSVTKPIAAWLALPVGTLVTVIPGTPGYVGTFDYFTAQALTLPGNSATAATACAFLVHALLWLPPTLLGGIYLLFNPARQRDSQRVIPDESF